MPMMPMPAFTPLSGCRCASAVFLLACSICLPALSQAAPPAPAKAPVSGPYRISGTVINGVSGEPIRRASVAVLAEEDSHAVESVLSDNEGRFVLSGLAAAKYQLTASKRGFHTAFFDEHEDFSTAIVTGPDQDTSGFTFKLVPGALLRGVVTGDGGDPVEGASVLLFRKPRAGRVGERVAQADTTITDDTGAYEFSNLTAGDYLLAVTAEPWYALHRASGTSGARPGDESAEALDVSYPVTYFDSVTDESSATTITLAAGEAEQANVSLHAVPALHLLVEMPHRQDGSFARPELRSSIFGVDVSAESKGFLDEERAGMVDFNGIPPGHYELAQGDPPRITELDATGSQRIDPSAGSPTVEVSGTVKTASGAALPGEIAVALEPFDGERQREPMQTVARRGSFRFPSVPVGRWMLSAEAAGVPLPVISAGAGNAAHAGDLLTVADHPLQVALTVATADMRVEGFARKAGKGIAGSMVVLVPRDLAAMRELARRDQSDSDGSFLLRNAAPGKYTVVAIEDGWDLDWTRPEVIRRFLPRGTAVTVPDTPVKLVTLHEPVAVQSP
jgi:hypothetical protein